MAEEHKCGECGRSFDSKRGLSIHQSQKHSESEEKQEDESVQNLNISLGLRQVAMLSFISGLVLGVAVISVAPSLMGYFPEGDDEPADWEETMTLEDRPFLGDEDAPITIVTYEDFFCPFCTAFHNEDFALANGMNSAFGDIKENYIDEGKVKYYFNYYPGSTGFEAHVAHESVLEHGSEEAYWEFQEMHFQNFERFSQEYQNSPEIYRESIKQEVEEMDVDYEEFESTFDANIEEVEHLLPVGRGFSMQFLNENVEEDVNQRLQNQIREGQEMGTEATPTIFVEGEMVRGAQPYRAFETVIEQHLD